LSSLLLLIGSCCFLLIAVTAFRFYGPPPGEDKSFPAYPALGPCIPDYQGRFHENSMPRIDAESALSDPLIRTLMAPDNVDPVKVDSMLRRIAEELKPSLSPSTEGRDLANNIPGARFVELPGEDPV
jgi:hypothetical protein